MMSMREMFYGQLEPVWVLKPEKKEDNKKGDDKGSSSGSKASEKQEYSILTSIPYYPYYYPDYVVPTKKKDDSKEDNKKKETKKETKVMLKVPMCCGECEEMVNVALYELKGVKLVECDTRREKVTVVVTTAAPADVLLECRRLFKKSRMWSDDD